MADVIILVWYRGTYLWMSIRMDFKFALINIYEGVTDILDVADNQTVSF